MGWAVVEFLERSISPHLDVRFRQEAFSVTRYMVSTAYDELRSSYPSLGAEYGAAEQIAVARKLDPGFARYDGEGNPRTGGTPELKAVDKRKYASGRFFAMLEDLHQRKPDLFVRYRQVMLRRNGSSPSYEAVIEDLCTAYGSDWPRRWPAAEDAVSVKKPAKESRGN